MPFEDKYNDRSSQTPAKVLVHTANFKEAYGTIEKAKGYASDVIISNEDLFTGINASHAIIVLWGKKKENKFVQMADVFAYETIGDDKWPGNPNVHSWVFENGIYVPPTKKISTSEFEHNPNTCGETLVELAEQEETRLSTPSLRKYLNYDPHIALSFYDEEAYSLRNKPTPFLTRYTLDDITRTDIPIKIYFHANRFLETFSSGKNESQILNASDYVAEVTNDYKYLIKTSGAKFAIASVWIGEDGKGNIDMAGIKPEAVWPSNPDVFLWYFKDGELQKPFDTMGEGKRSFHPVTCAKTFRIYGAEESLRQRTNSLEEFISKMPELPKNLLYLNKEIKMPKSESI